MKSLIVGLIVVLMIITPAVAAKYLIIHPIENEDGTELTDLKGIIAHCGDSAIDLGLKTVWEGPADCEFRAYDINSNVSKAWTSKIGVKPYPPIVLIYGDTDE